MSVGKMLLIAASCVVASAQMRDRLMMNSRGEPLGARSHPLPPRRAVAKEDFIDVLDYGAVGDNKTDNTAAFQSAIKAAAALDGIQVLFKVCVRWRLFRDGATSSVICSRNVSRFTFLLASTFLMETSLWFQASLSKEAMTWSHLINSQARRLQ